MTDACVFVTGVWKSGNHLAYSALNEMGVPGPFNGLSGHLLYGRHAWAKRLIRSPRDTNDAVSVGLETDAMVSQRFIAREAKRLSGKILGGHAAYSGKLIDTLKRSGVRMICIRRDPRDILVSFADWIGSRPDFYLHRDFVHLSRSQRIEKLLQGGPGTGYVLQPFEQVLNRAQGWLIAPDVLQIQFEHLVGARGGGDQADQAKIVAKMHAHVGARIPLADVALGNIYGGSLTFNQGRSRRWRELDDPKLIERIETSLAPQLNAWGYAY